jgi:succinyl-CoA synthetase beta subunit
VTPQTDAVGLPVNAVLIEEGISIEREIYFGMLVDRELERITLMVSASGGMDIEEIAETDPEALLHIVVDPLVGLQPYQCRQICFDLGLGGELLDQLAQIMMGMYQLFIEKDLNLIEINPMVLTAEGRLLALDAKVDVDDNALFRQPLMEEMRDLTQEDEIEIRASRHGLNYITLDGNIACMVNGAGLAMATMDVIRLYGGYPANFLDVGGTTTPERVAEAIKIILSCSNVEALLINIFGGIVRCDLIAEGIILAHEEVGISIPLVVRVQGTHVERCHQLLEQSGLPLVMADDLTDAAKKVMSAVGQSVSEDAR